MARRALTHSWAGGTPSLRLSMPAFTQATQTCSGTAKVPGPRLRVSEVCKLQPDGPRARWARHSTVSRQMATEAHSSDAASGATCSQPLQVTVPPGQGHDSGAVDAVQGAQRWRRRHAAMTGLLPGAMYSPAAQAAESVPPELMSTLQSFLVRATPSVWLMNAMLHFACFCWRHVQVMPPLAKHAAARSSVSMS